MTRKTVLFGEKKEQYDTKLWAISDALKVTIKETRQLKNMVVTIFINLSAAIINIKKTVAKPERLALKDFIYLKAN